MSRTYRKNYQPILFQEQCDEAYHLEYADHYIKTGLSLDGLKYHTTDYTAKTALGIKRFNDTRTRDGNKTHNNIDAIANKSIKYYNGKTRVKLAQEMKNMMAGNIGFDELIENANKIRMHQRSFVWYDIT
ncbi:hypothetical protein POP12_011 [Pectobacterium phage POP12]|nr:hypothetical protein POP12_011 [Pectobacterium phage POP12]